MPPIAHQHFFLLEMITFNQIGAQQVTQTCKLGKLEREFLEELIGKRWFHVPQKRY